MDINGLSSTYSDIYSTMAGSQSANKLEGQLNTDYSKATDEELMRACKEFESYFLEQVFKQMWKTVPKAEESTGANSTLMELTREQMIQEMAATSTEQKSLGLAQSLYEQMKRNYSV